MITIRNNTPQMIEISCAGGMRILLPDGDLALSADALDSGQLQHLAETGRVTVVAAEQAPEQAALEAAEASDAPSRAAKKTAKKRP